VIVDSDRGSQFRSRDFVAVLKAAGVSGSMGRVAAAGDNAAMEPFNALLQKNVLDRQRWATRDQLRYAISTGSSTPTTGAGSNADSAASPPSSSNSPSPTKQHDHTQPPSTKPTADPCAAFDLIV
jgi:transposase InsO family protein